MNQMNNNEYYFDVDKLYKIAEKLNTEAVIKKMPSNIMQERYNEAKLNYIKALTDFDFFVKNYIKDNEGNFLFLDTIEK